MRIVYGPYNKRISESMRTGKLSDTVDIHLPSNNHLYFNETFLNPVIKSLKSKEVL
jgi:hypothetical protein